MTTEAGSLQKLWKPGRRWRDAEGFPAMIDLPLGLFTMGEREDDKFATDTERPKHRVEIGYPIALGCYPVTVAEFSAFSGGVFAPEEAALPAASISWVDASAYVGWLAEKTRHGYRLPSEAEWEYACCAGSAWPFPTGNTLTLADANYMYDEQGNKVGEGARVPVGSYASNAFGLYDMVGNIAEWVSDSWHPTLQGAPDEGQSWGGNDPGDGLRVLRGGSWDYLPRLLRSAWRDYLHQEVRRDNVGFRVACGALVET